jgi:hypothetical protein
MNRLSGDDILRWSMYRRKRALIVRGVPHVMLSRVVSAYLR